MTKKGLRDCFRHFHVTLVVGLLFSLIAFPAAGPIARFLVSGDGVLTTYTRDYIRISMLGAPVIGIGLMMVNYLGVENHPELASVYLIAANVINLVLDYIFLRFTPLGVTGASLSTVLGFLFAMVVFLFYIRSDKRNISFVRLNAKDFGIVKEAVVTGVPMLVFMATNFVKALGLNTIIMNQIGEDGMAVFTVCDNVLLIVEMLTGGIIGVIPNVAGILFGEKDYVGIRVLCKKMLKYSYIVLAVIFVLIMLFTEQITIMFGGGGELGREMVHALRIFALCVVPYLWNKFTVSYYESIEETAIASFVTFLENAVAVLPATFIGISIWKQIDGIGTKWNWCCIRCHRDHNSDRSLGFPKDQTQKFYFLYCSRSKIPEPILIFPLRAPWKKQVQLTEKSWSSAKKTVYPETEPILLPCVQKK